MSSLTLKGDPSGSGTFTVQSPNSNTSRTITLPDATTTLVGTDATQTLTNKTIQGGALTLGTAVASTSGTAIDFTGIPSWVKRVTVMFVGVSTSGASPVQVQLGTSSGVASTGYDTRVFTWTGGNQGSSATSGFLVESSNSAPTAAAVRQGNVVFANITGNTWSGTGIVSWATINGTMSSIVGSIALSGTLDRIRITTVNGTDTFDAGTINIMLEG